MDQPSSANIASFLDAARTAIGGAQVLTAENDKDRFERDFWNQNRGRAAAVLRPGSTQDVANVVRLAAKHGVSIVPQSGNTGLVSGGIPDQSGTEVVLSFERMDKVRAIDPAGDYMIVEAGCVLQAVQQAAAGVGRFFPLAMGSGGSCRIGGNLSTNAGGVQVLRYGNARNLVLGLEVVLPNGDIWNGLRSLKKDNTGYDLKHLFMGAEGTLGIITKAVLKLWPAAKDGATAWLAIRDPQAAIEILSDAHSASEDNVESCELMSREATDMVLRHIPGVQDPLKAETPWYILMQWNSSRPRTEGAEGMAEKMEQFLADQMEAGRVLDAVIAQNESQSRNMWKIREGVAEAGRADGPGLSYDISVSISKIPEFIDKGIKAAQAILPTLRPHPLGHIGDGNVHFGFGAPKGMDQPTLQQYAPAVTRAVNDLITSMAGSISAEHGIGIEKLDELQHYRSKIELDTMRTIKRALDPKNIMNPGKVLRLS